MVVEHDADTLLACDHLIEVGPGPGVKGELLFSGDIKACIASDKSVSGNFLSGKESVQKIFFQRNHRRIFLKSKKREQII